MSFVHDIFPSCLVRCLIQDGVAGATYADGDRASRLGHLGLITMQQVGYA